jgi:alpha-L-rhamnosidase
MNGESQKILSGNLEAWCYQTLGGINYDPERPGFKHIILQPRPVGDLQWVRASFQSLYGRIDSQWTRRNQKFLWHVSVPPNTTATVYVPAGDKESVKADGRPAWTVPGISFLRMAENSAVCEIGSGEYEFLSTVP